jgi:hypothetical protein
MSLAVVLAVGLNSQLLDIRRMLFQSASFIVMTVRSMEEAFHLFVKGDIDLVALRQSISEGSRDGLTCMIRASCSLTLVVGIAKHTASMTSLRTPRSRISHPNCLPVFDNC